MLDPYTSNFWLIMRPNGSIFQVNMVHNASNLQVMFSIQAI